MLPFNSLDLQRAGLKLKEHYVNVEQPLSEMDGDTNYTMREDVYIDLVVLPSSTVDKEWSNSDRAALMEQQYISKSTSTKAIDQILLSSDELVFLSGIGGMGKTTLLDMFTYKWAKGDLHNEAANIEFIFKFTCRNLNNISNSFTNLEELFRLKFPAVMKFISFNDLMEISERVLIVVDGLDELKNLYVTENSSTFTTDNLSQIVIDLLNPKGHWLPKHKVIACGRPKASEFVKKHLPMNSKRQTIEVCGFNDENIRKYIQKFFGDHKEKAVAVQEIIERSYDLHIMARVPVFLYIICNVYQEELIKSPINTQTELYFFTTLVFIRNHFKKQSQPYRISI